MEHIVKSFFYLGAFTTLGYVLMKVTEPNPEKLKAIRNTTYSDPQSSDNRKRTELIIQKLKEAAGEPPSQT